LFHREGESNSKIIVWEPHVIKGNIPIQNFPFQFSICAGSTRQQAVSRSTSTDADVIYTTRDGIPCGLISIPLRYMHSSVETVAMTDVHHAASLAGAFIRSLDKSDTFRVLD
jgi:hypothetical protein